MNWPSELRRLLKDNLPRRFDAFSPRQGDRPDAYLEISISSLTLDGTNGVAGGVILAEDVTARIGAERRLAAAERLAAVGKLAARVAHELNNPLDAVLRYASLAQRRIDAATDPKLAEYLGKIQAGVARMGGITSALLSFSRSSPTGFEQTTINRVVEDALGAMEGRTRAHDVSIDCDFRGGDVPVARATSLFQVFCNLIKNAVDAMPTGGSLTITTDAAGPDVVVVFADTGVGLPDEIERIFEPFFTTKPPGEGTGLGLAVCKELIQQLGGTISAARGEPKGTVMTVKLPVRDCGAASRHLMKLGGSGL